jgi:post-segregation antitoxin (ccd killing protein)
MPKVTVYVPDGLLERVRKLDPEVNMSALFQQAIQSEAERLAAQQDTVASVKQLVNVTALKEKFRAGRAAQVEAERAAYRAGYQFMLEHAESIPYHVFEAVGRYSWQAENVLEATARSTFQALTDLANEEGYPREIVYRGAEGALTAVWNTIDAELAAE